MFDRLFNLLEAIWEWFIPWVIIDQYERGVILRLGKFKREIGPGLRWVLPFGIENCKYDTVVNKPTYLDVQSLTSKDGKAVAIAAITRSSILDITRYLLDNENGEEVANNIVYGAVSDAVESHNWDKIKTEAFTDVVYDAAMLECLQVAGVALADLRWSDKCIARHLRLWND